MNIWVCDRCGKQIDRFVKEVKYDMRKKGEDRTGKSAYLRNLQFCDECNEKLEKLADEFLSPLPEKVEVTLDPNE